VDIVVKKGLDVPLKGKAFDFAPFTKNIKQCALNLEPFDDLRFKLLVKEGQSVSIGEPLVENKSIAGQFFASPASGAIAEFRRGAKRRLIDVVINVDGQKKLYKHDPMQTGASKEQILERLMQGGIFPYIRMRPFNKIADPKRLPRDIFVSAVESLPYQPTAEMQVEGFEKEFQHGLDVLNLLTEGSVHLVVHKESACAAFTEAGGVCKHTVSGPHPCGSSSLHIHKIAPVTSTQDVIWSLSVTGVIAVGKMVGQGLYHIDRVVGVAGEGVQPDKRNFFKARAGLCVADLVSDKLEEQPLRLISGDPLTGQKVSAEDFLGFDHTSCSVLLENQKRQLLHFFRLGRKKYSATRAYLSGHLPAPKEGAHFTTNQHGEERAFIDGKVYDKVMPMRIPTMHLIKAILAEDFELAEELGLLEVIPEDFALASFICPSKIEMIDIVKRGLHHYAVETGHHT